METGEILDVAGLVSLRKTELYRSILDGIPEDEELSEQEKQTINVHISKMSFEKFLTEEELKTQTISTENTIEDIELDKEGILSSLEIEIE